VPRNHFDGIASADETVRRIQVALQNMKLQAALLDAYGRQTPRPRGCRIHAPEKYHCITHASVWRKKNRRVGVGLDLSLGKRVPSDWTGPDEERGYDWNVALPNDSSMDDACRCRIEVANRGRWRRFTTDFRLGKILSATSHHYRNEAQGPCSSARVAQTNQNAIPSLGKKVQLWVYSKRSTLSKMNVLKQRLAESEQAGL